MDYDVDDYALLEETELLTDLLAVSNHFEGPMPLRAVDLALGVIDDERGELRGEAEDFIRDILSLRVDPHYRGTGEVRSLRAGGAL